MIILVIEIDRLTFNVDYGCPLEEGASKINCTTHLPKFQSLLVCGSLGLVRQFSRLEAVIRNERMECGALPTTHLLLRGIL